MSRFQAFLPKFELMKIQKGLYLAIGVFSLGTASYAQMLVTGTSSYLYLAYGYGRGTIVHSDSFDQNSTTLASSYSKNFTDTITDSVSHPTEGWDIFLSYDWRQNREIYGSLNNARTLSLSTSGVADLLSHNANLGLGTGSGGNRQTIKFTLAQQTTFRLYGVASHSAGDAAYSWLRRTTMGTQTVAEYHVADGPFDVFLDLTAGTYELETFADMNQSFSWQQAESSDHITTSTTVTLEAVPEPASMAALGLGIFALARKRRSK